MRGDGLQGIPDSWRLRRLEEVSTIVDSLHKTPSYSDAGYPMVRVTDVKGGFLDLSETLFVSEGVFEEFTRRHVPNRGDIIFSRVGTYGNASYVATCSPFCLGQNTAIISPKINSRFLYYCLQAPLVRHQIEQMAVGSTQKTISLQSISALQIPVPPEAELEAIAHILGTLDDKIELNRRMNETMEAMAGAIFKSWFVDFDPVRAKMNGCDPGLPTPIADLFPDRFEDSELGAIPAGWNVGPILTQARLLSGGTPKTDRKEFWDGEIHWASAKDVSQCGQTFLVETERSITQKGLDESATQLIPAYCTVVVARGATTGRMVMLGRQMAMNQTCYALASTTDTPFTLYCHLRDQMENFVHAAHGSVFDTITTSTFANTKVVLPSDSVLKAFEQKVSPIFHRMLGNTEEIQSLAALRDTLLPKLISGELRVSQEKYSTRTATTA